MSRFHTHYEVVKLEVACVKKAPASSHSHGNRWLAKEVLHACHRVSIMSMVTMTTSIKYSPLPNTPAGHRQLLVGGVLCGHPREPTDRAATAAYDGAVVPLL